MPPLSHDLLLYAGLAIAALIAVNLVTRRIPLIGTLLRFAVWGVAIVLVVGAVPQRSLFDPYFAKLTHFLDLQPADDQQVSGERKLLVDSGATITALSVDTAEAAGLVPEKSPFPIILKTANGAVAARTARVATLRIGNVVARDLPVVVSPSFGDTEVIGMNFLSKLKSWRVEGDTLILEPHHPQFAANRDA
ncbi:MAG: TIGR02281 family clan AA aspartic protease [Sphingomonas sp.]|nr:TIGR02281 family clan AA aspartic protease [Sphingomonas sp.]